MTTKTEQELAWEDEFASEGVREVKSKYPEVCETCGAKYEKPFPFLRGNSAFCSNGFHCCRECKWKNGKVIDTCSMCAGYEVYKQKIIDDDSGIGWGTQDLVNHIPIVSLDRMFEQQETFMKLLVEKRGFPKFPVDLTSKEGQKLVKQISYEAADELHEARYLLKNSKNHRATEISEFDREAYLEELADATHFLFEIIIASGFTLEEFYDAYMAKGYKNFDRISKGY